MGSRYDDFCAEDSKAVNHPLDEALTSDSLYSLVPTKPRTSATSENDGCHAQKTPEIQAYVSILDKARQLVIACLGSSSPLEYQHKWRTKLHRDNSWVSAGFPS